MPTTMTVCSKCHSLNRVATEKALEDKATCGKCGTDLKMHGLVSEVSGDDLKRVIAKADKPVIVDFWANWCGPCKTYTPIFEQASKENTDAIFLKIDTEKNPSVSSELGIRGIPTTILFKQGREAKRESGILPEYFISQFLR